MTKQVSIFVFLFILFTTHFTEASSSILLHKIQPNVTLEILKENILIAYTANCFPKELSNWSCFWCKQTKQKIDVKHYFNHTETDTFGFIGETEQNS
jgi:hypothetical protein